MASRAKALKLPSIDRNESTWLVSPLMQATMSASPACTARAARRTATTPLAPPIGTWSSQRGLTPRCCVRPTAVSGVSEKLDTHRPSIASLGTPDCLTSSASTRPRNHGAPFVEKRS